MQNTQRLRFDELGQQMEKKPTSPRPETYGRGGRRVLGAGGPGRLATVLGEYWLRIALSFQGFLGSARPRTMTGAGTTGIATRCCSLSSRKRGDHGKLRKESGGAKSANVCWSTMKWPGGPVALGAAAGRYCSRQHIWRIRCGTQAYTGIKQGLTMPLMPAAVPKGGR